jgi:hypothetical protein
VQEVVSLGEGLHGHILVVGFLQHVLNDRCAHLRREDGVTLGDHNEDGALDALQYRSAVVGYVLLTERLSGRCRRC